MSRSPRKPETLMGGILKYTGLSALAGLVGLAGTALGLAVRVDRVTAARRLALATAVRVIHGVHGYATVGRTDAMPASAAGLAEGHVLVLEVAELLGEGEEDSASGE